MQLKKEGPQTSSTRMDLDKRCESLQDTVHINGNTENSRFRYLTLDRCPICLFISASLDFHMGGGMVCIVVGHTL